MDIDFEAFPQWLREGAWCVEAKMSIVAIGLGLVVCWRALSKDNIPMEPADLTRRTRLTYGIGALYCISILFGMFRVAGVWPMATYTMVSWVMLSLRYLSSAFGIWKRQASILRFPSIAQSFVTVSLWWFVLVPIIRANMTGQALHGFDRFNHSFLLLNVHGVNLVLSLLDTTVLSPRRLESIDLWFGIAFAYAYSLFYLGFLDTRGLHFYIILSPRTRFAPLIYASILLYYYTIFRLFSALANRTLASGKFRSS